MSKLNVPLLRFPEFSEEWEERRYGDIYSFYPTNSLSRDKLNYEDGSVKNIHYGDIHTKFSTMFDIECENVPFVNNEIDLSKVKEESYCLKGDLVIADASEDYTDIGKTIELINLNNEKVIAGLHTFLARPTKDDIALGFVGYLLQSWKIRKQVMTIAQGTKVLGVSTGRLSKIKLDLPLKPEQTKIADFLTSVDTKIEQLTKKHKLLEEYKKGMMQKIFSKELRFHPKGTSLQAQGENDDDSEFPDWKEKRLEKLCEIIKSGGTPISTKESYYDGNIPFLAISDMTKQGKYLEYTTKSISDEGLKSSATWLLPENTLIYSMYASVGFVSINKIPLTTSQAVINLIFNKFVNTEYMYYYLTNFKKYVHRFIDTGVQGNLNAQTVKSFKIEFPVLQEQEKIADFLSAIDHKVDIVSKEIKSTKKFKKGLLQQMFV